MPESIEEAVARLNALPPPRNLECYLASLPRPLEVVATTSPFSLQPADGELGPRIFILGEKLIASVVPLGPGSHYLELGELVDPRRTIKGEIEFPLPSELAPDEPYTHIVEQERQCEFCHRETTPHPTISGATISLAFKPRENTLVPLSTLKQIRAGCDEEDGEGEHCALMRALFDYGEVEAGVFPEAMETFF